MLFLLHFLSLTTFADWYHPASSPLFQNLAPLEWEIRAKELPLIQTEVRGVLQYIGGPVMQVKLSPRGNERRNLCESFPPFKIKFKESEMPGTLFAGSADSIHYVTHCRIEKAEEYTERLFLEYGVYRLLYESGLPSLMVRLAKANYVGERQSVAAYGMIPENKKDAAKRLQIRPDSAAAPHERLMAEIHLSLLLTQNADANISMEHNVIAYRNQKNEIVSYLAYDFDLSNLVYPEFFKNQDADWDDASRLQQIARAYGRETLRSLLRGIFSRRPQMELSIEQGFASENGKNRLQKRLQKFFQAAESYL